VLKTTHLNSKQRDPINGLIGSYQIGLKLGFRSWLLLFGPSSCCLLLLLLAGSFFFDLLFHLAGTAVDVAVELRALSSSVGAMFVGSLSCLYLSQSCRYDPPSTPSTGCPVVAGHSPPAPCIPISLLVKFGMG